MDKVFIKKNTLGDTRTAERMPTRYEIGYVQCFTNWCRHWATDELKWIGGDDE